MEQNVHFWDKMETDVPGVRKSCGARLHPRNVSSKVWSRKGWYIHLPSTSRTEDTAQNVQNLENGTWGHFPLGFWGENFEKFRKIFLIKNVIRTHFRYLNSISEDVGQVYAPIRHIGSFNFFLLKMAIYPQMRKIGGCA